VLGINQQPVFVKQHQELDSTKATTHPFEQ
jgi:hypothetical protein